MISTHVKRSMVEERYDGKLSRTVLKRGLGSDTHSYFNYFAHKCGCMDTAEGKKAVISALAPRPVDPKEKSIRPKQIRYWTYYSREGKPLVRVCRSDFGDERKPRRWQESWDGQKWVKGLKGVKRENIPIYKYKEIKEALSFRCAFGDRR